MSYDGTTPLENEIVKIGLCSENARKTINDLIFQTYEINGFDYSNRQFKKYNAEKVACFQWIEAEAKKGKTAKEIIRDCKVSRGFIKSKKESAVKNDNELNIIQSDNDVKTNSDLNITQLENDIVPIVEPAPLELNMIQSIDCDKFVSINYRHADNSRHTVQLERFYIDALIAIGITDISKFVAENAGVATVTKNVKRAIVFELVKRANMVKK